MDLCFELASQVMARLGSAVTLVEEVHGVRYFDHRDLVGFVDRTENPTGQAAVDATIIGHEDLVFAGGSYVIVQKYARDLTAWNALATAHQRRERHQWRERRWPSRGGRRSRRRCSAR